MSRSDDLLGALQDSVETARTRNAETIAELRVETCRPLEPTHTSELLGEIARLRARVAERGELRALHALRRRYVITTDPGDRDVCCGLPRDDNGFCVHRPGHPIFVDMEG